MREGVACCAAGGRRRDAVAGSGEFATPLGPNRNPSPGNLSATSKRLLPVLAIPEAES